MKVLKILKKPAVLGWLLWFITTLLLAGPAVMLMYRITYDTANALTRIVSGVFGAAIFSGVLVTLAMRSGSGYDASNLLRLRKRTVVQKRNPGRKNNCVPLLVSFP